jgi:predicted transposase YbfD/YdcC
VYLPGEGVTLAQVAIESKQNEITAAPTLIGYVDLRNKVVVAMPCTPKDRYPSKLARQEATTFGL